MALIIHLYRLKHTHSHSHSHTHEARRSPSSPLSPGLAVLPGYDRRNLSICDRLATNSVSSSQILGWAPNEIFSSFLATILVLFLMWPAEYESANFMSFYHPQRICVFLEAKLLPATTCRVSFFCEAQVGWQFPVTFRKLHERPRQNLSVLSPGAFLSFRMLPRSYR